jgi:hypothetical protein
MTRSVTAPLRGGVLLALPLALWPVYHARNARIRAEAELARATLATINETLAEKSDARIVIVSPADARPSIADAFGTGFEDAIDLFVPNARPSQVTTGPHDRSAQPGERVFVVEGTRLTAR